MWKNTALALSLAGALATAPAAMAHPNDISINGESCEIDIKYAVEIGPDFATVSDGALELYAIQPGSELVVDGRPVALTERQQIQIERFRRALHKGSRELVEIALDAVDVAIAGVAIALAILSDDESIAKDMQAAADRINLQAKARFYGNNEVYRFSDAGIEDFIEEHVEGDFEKEVEKLAMRAAGDMSWEILKAIFTGGRNIERRAEKLERELERDVEERAEVLEERAEGLCEQLEQINELETKLHQSIPQLAKYDLLIVKN